MSQPTSTTVYGKILPNTSKSLVKSKVDKLTGFKYPIEASPLRGYFSKQSGNNLVNNMLKCLLRTYKGERFMLPNYGCNLKDYLMEPLDETTFESIKTAIYQSITRYLKSVRIGRLQVFEDASYYGVANSLKVKLFCSIVDEANNILEVNIKV